MDILDQSASVYNRNNETSAVLKASAGLNVIGASVVFRG
jgi:hypothetical protein